MDVVFQHELSVLHPLTAHFPVAFLTAALLLGMIWLGSGHRFWRLSILLMMLMGSLGTVIAFLSGTPAIRRPGSGVLPLGQLLELHNQASLYTMVLALATTAVLLGLNFYLERRTTIRRYPPDPVWVRVLVFVFLTATSVALGFTAYSGHLLGWAEG